MTRSWSDNLNKYYLLPIVVLQRPRIALSLKKQNRLELAGFVSLTRPSIVSMRLVNDGTSIFPHAVLERL